MIVGTKGGVGLLDRVGVVCHSRNFTTSIAADQCLIETCYDGIYEVNAQVPF